MLALPAPLWATKTEAVERVRRRRVCTRPETDHGLERGRVDDSPAPVHSLLRCARVGRCAGRSVHGTCSTDGLALHLLSVKSGSRSRRLSGKNFVPDVTSVTYLETYLNERKK